MKYKAVAVGVFSIGMLSGCVQQGEIATLQNRIAQQEQQIQQISGQLSGVQPAQADTWSQVQTLRQEMAQLKGQIDNLNHATSSTGGVAGLADTVTRHDAALRTVESTLSVNLNLGAPAAGSTPYSQGLSPIQPQIQPQIQTPVAENPAPQDGTPATQQADAAKTLYDAGYKFFTEQNFIEALNVFTNFTNTYPKHNLVGNAWFWKGESNFRLKNYANAALDYEQVISKFPQNQKVPAAYLKQAMSFSEVNKKDVARFRLEDLIKKFPKAPEVARAKKMLTEL